VQSSTHHIFEAHIANLKQNTSSLQRNNPLVKYQHSLEPEFTLHIFFECPSFPPVIAAIQAQYKHWFEEPLVWDTSTILLLKHRQKSDLSMHLRVLAIVFRLL